MPGVSLHKRPWAWLVLLLLLAAAGFATWRMLRPPEVDGLRLQPAPLVRTLQFSARVASDLRVDVGATVTGRVEQVLVREGDAVSAGQPLVLLESAELQAALRQAEASEQQARARLGGLRSTGRQAATAAVAQAEAQWRNARSELSRNEQLLAQGFVSQARVDDARRALDVAAAQREAAQAQASATGDRGTDVAQAQAQIALARAATVAARSRLDQARVVAPTAGRVLVRNVEPGLIVQPGRALLSLALQGPRELVAQVDERFLEQLRVGQSAQAVADAFPQQPFAARVRQLAPAVDPQRGAIEVKLALDGEPREFLREDMTVSVEVETGRRERALTIPLSALRGTDRVLVAQDDRVASREVRLGLRTIDAAEVVEGLQAGEVVLTGRQPPAPGERVHVRLVPWSPGPALPVQGAVDASSALSNAMGR